LSPAALFAAAAAADAEAAAAVSASAAVRVDAAAQIAPLLAAVDISSECALPVGDSKALACASGAVDGHASAAAAFERAVDSAVTSNAGNDSDGGFDNDGGGDDDEAAGHKPQGKQLRKAAPGKPIDLADEELFPSLGSPPSAKAGPAAWGARPAAGAPAAGAGPQSMAAQLRLKRATEVLDLPKMEGPIADTVRKIMERTKTHIEVSHNRVLSMSTYLVSGRPESVAKAKREICAKLSPQVTKVVQVPALARAQIAGVRSRTLLGIQEQTHTTIALPKHSGAGPGAADGDSGLFEMIDVSVTGDHSGVTAAIAQIEAIVDRTTTKRAVRLTDIPRALHALLMGKGGETLHALQAAHPQVQIVVPGPLEDKPVSVIGDRDEVQAAVAKIKETAHALMQTAQTITVTIPKRQHQFIVGPGGRTLAEISLATGCSVSVPQLRSASEQVTVHG
ncbi:hypothetical protein H4R21_006225, partial [Coemansia helicoidea]